LALSVAILAIGAAALAATPPVGGGAAADEATIREREDQERSAVLAQDFAALERVWSEEFMVNAPNNQVVAGRSRVLAVFRQGIAHYGSFERRIEQIRFSGDYAVVMGGETVKPIDKAPLAGKIVERRFTHVWRREGDTFRLLARHANVMAVR
jgi:ketosteroid isomerase-like protein